MTEVWLEYLKHKCEIFVSFDALSTNTNTNKKFGKTDRVQVSDFNSLWNPNP